jgi:hypothetical protein
MDGCATFYKRDKFTLVKKYEVGRRRWAAPGDGPAVAWRWHRQGALSAGLPAGVGGPTAAALPARLQVEFNKAALSLAEQMGSPQQKKQALNRLLKVGCSCSRASALPAGTLGAPVSPVAARRWQPEQGCRCNVLQRQAESAPQAVHSLDPDHPPPLSHINSPPCPALAQHAPSLLQHPSSSPFPAAHACATPPNPPTRVLPSPAPHTPAPPLPPLQDNVALIAVLEALEPSGPEAAGRSRQLICVANTHIHANPELNDVKLWQVHTLLKGLEKIAAR